MKNKGSSQPLTRRTATSTLPSTLQANVNTSPTSRVEVHALLRVSQNRTVPSPEQLANSNSLTGLNSTFSTADPWPSSFVWLLGAVFSGFHTRIVLSVDPVAICDPDAFHDIVRWL